MNTTLFASSFIFTNVSVTTIVIESWFIPIDIVRTSCNVLSMVLSAFFLFIIIVDKTFHQIFMLLTADSCLSAFIFASDMCGMGIFALQNDLKQIQIQDSLCYFRFYMGVASCTAFNFSFLLQATYRYFIVVYPQCLYWQSVRFQTLLIVLTWIFSYLWPVALFFTGDIIYNVDNQICQLFLRLSFSIIYMTCCAYMMPILFVMFIYVALVRYVKEMSKNVTPVNALARAQRSLKIVHRLVILVSILIALGLPYTVFILISFFTYPPKYHFRIAFIFIDISLVCVMVALFRFTEPLKLSIMKRIKRRSNMVIAEVEQINNTMNMRTRM